MTLLENELIMTGKTSLLWQILWCHSSRSHKKCALFMTLQKPVIVSQTYYDRCSINSHNKPNSPPHNLTMLGQLVNLLWKTFVKPIIVSPTYYDR